MENTNEYKKVAQEVRKRVEQELPVLEGMLDAVNGGDNIQLIPQVVHTIAVVRPEKSHLFLKDADTLYGDIVKKGKTEEIAHDLWKAVKKYYSVIHKLFQQEQEEYVRQLAHYKGKLMERKLEDDSIDVDAMLEEETKFFQHVECDISSSLKSYIFLLIIGYIPSNIQREAMFSMLSIGRTILAESVEKHRKTLETTKQILGEEE